MFEFAGGRERERGGGRGELTGLLELAGWLGWACLNITLLAPPTLFVCLQATTLRSSRRPRHATTTDSVHFLLERGATLYTQPARSLVIGKVYVVGPAGMDGGEASEPGECEVLVFAGKSDTGALTFTGTSSRRRKATPTELAPTDEVYLHPHHQATTFVTIRLLPAVPKLLAPECVSPCGIWALAITVQPKSVDATKCTWRWSTIEDLDQYSSATSGTDAPPDSWLKRLIDGETPLPKESIQPIGTGSDDPPPFPPTKHLGASLVSPKKATKPCPNTSRRKSAPG